jgi:hypothetical protein
MGRYSLGIKRFNLQSQIHVRFPTLEIFFSNTGIFNMYYWGQITLVVKVS